MCVHEYMCVCTTVCVCVCVGEKDVASRINVNLRRLLHCTIYSGLGLIRDRARVGVRVRVSAVQFIDL